jgi:hypothetical protein
MYAHDIALTRHNGEPWTLQVGTLDFGGVKLRLLDENGQDCIRATIQPVGEFYQILLPNLNGNRRNPFVSWAEGHERLGELWPQFQPLFVAKVTDLLNHPIIQALRLREFYRFLRQAAITNQGVSGEESADKLQLVFNLKRIHVQPRMVQALFRIFPSAETGA